MVGYCGGTTVNPTYHRIGDHMESIQIEFDPSIISYDKLLRIFFQEHDYTAQPWSRQYMNGVFYHSEEQKQSLARAVEAMPGTVRTEIAEFTAFFAAENYHQKFYLQRHAELMQEYQVIYPEFTRLVRSTAVARVNGFLGGYGHSGLLQSVLFDLGLSEQAGIFLLERLRMREISG